MRRATIEIESDENALLRDALSPETERTIPRTTIAIENRGDVLNIEIVATDINALRAAINSYLRWVSVGLKAAELKV
ncbi:MAG: hypothetical protein KAX31_04185 [Thermoplasmata archaeon]|nr:hypothetical protein [Thermoplasmata archaeon]